MEILSDLSRDSIVQTCNDFEALLRYIGDSVQHHHCDNVTFSDNSFSDHCKPNKMHLTYCAAYGHHKNGICKIYIGILTKDDRKNLWHDMFCWIKVLLLNLWTYNVIQSNIVRKKLPHKANKSLIKLFSSSAVEPNMQHFHYIFPNLSYFNRSLIREINSNMKCTHLP